MTWAGALWPSKAAVSLEETPLHGPDLSGEGPGEGGSHASLSSPTLSYRGLRTKWLYTLRFWCPGSHSHPGSTCACPSFVRLCPLLFPTPVPSSCPGLSFPASRALHEELSSSLTDARRSVTLLGEQLDPRNPRTNVAVDTGLAHVLPQGLLTSGAQLVQCSPLTA